MSSSPIRKPGYTYFTITGIFQITRPSGFFLDFKYDPATAARRIERAIQPETFDRTAAKDAAFRLSDRDTAGGDPIRLVGVG